MILVASNLLFTRTSRRRRLPFQFQSPIVMTSADPMRHRRIQLQSPVATAIVTETSLQTAVGAGASLGIRPVATALLADRSQCLGLGDSVPGCDNLGPARGDRVGSPLPFYLSTGYLDPSFMMLIDIAIALVAGINVFGMENRGRTQRFLTHHGARPGLVWLVKLMVWCLGLFLIWGPQAVVMYNAQSPPPNLPHRKTYCRES